MAEQVKVSWKFGNLEMQYEGDEEFLKSGFPQLFQKLLDIYKSGPKNGELEPPELPRVTENPVVENPNGGKLEYSVNTIAKKLNVKKPKELAMAACAYLILREQKETFSRKEILAAMQSAKQYYKESHRKSLTQYIEALMNEGFLLERSPDIYAVDGDKLETLRATFAN